MILRVYLTKSGTANISCPQCGEQKSMDVKKFAEVDKEVRLKCTCKCKHIFSILLERRLHVRKDVFLTGEVLLNKKKYPVDIVNISRTGMRLRTKGRLNVNLLDKINIEFVLDDSTHSIVRKETIARTMRENEIGLEFVDRNHYDKLGAYLLFHFS